MSEVELRILKYDKVEGSLYEYTVQQLDRGIWRTVLTGCSIDYCVTGALRILEASKKGEYLYGKCEELYRFKAKVV